MGWLDSVRESRRMRAAHAANAKELEAKLAAQQHEQHEQEMAYKREIGTYLASIIISSESVESYAARHPGGIAIIDVPGVDKSVGVRERRYYSSWSEDHNCKLEEKRLVVKRTMPLGDIDYLKRSDMFAILGAQCNVNPDAEEWRTVYYGLPVRRVQNGEKVIP